MTIIAEHTLLKGPAGTGKTFWARQQASLLDMKNTAYEADTAIRRIYSAAMRDYSPVSLRAPFRAPHHTVSVIGLTGALRDGYAWQPGELSLAHGGVLFLDELAEFSARALEEIVRALTHGYVALSSVKGTVIHAPATFRLVAAVNLCPCGWQGTLRPCTCTTSQVKAYEARYAVIRPFFRNVLGPDEYRMTELARPVQE